MSEENEVTLYHEWVDYCKKHPTMVDSGKTFPQWKRDRRIG